MSNRRIAWCRVIALSVVSCWASTASASPWTLGDGETTLDIGYDFQFAGEEYLPDGEFQRFPLDGQFVSNGMRVGVRHALTERLELGATATFKSVAYTADAVILELPEDPTLEDARASVLDFNQSAFGAGDVYFTGRYNFVKGTLAAANEVRLKFPTGYTPPQGTFDETSGAIADDVSLGDGQTDLEDSFLVGIFVPTTRTFARADIGFRLRFGGAGHQVFGALKVGQFIGDHMLMFVGTNGAYSVTQGKVIGKTAVARAPDVTAAEIRPAQVELIDLRLDKDWLNIEGGLLFLVTERLELQAVYQRLLVGRNIPVLNTFSIGTAVKLGGRP